MRQLMNNGQMAKSASRIRQFGLIAATQATSGNFLKFLVALFVAWVALALLLPTGGPVGPSKMMTARVGIINIEAALEQFKAVFGCYPTTQEGLSALIDRPSTIPESQWPGGDIHFLNPVNFLVTSNGQKVPTDPWNHAYIYKRPGVHNTNGFDIYSLGPPGNERKFALDNWTIPPK